MKPIYLLDECVGITEEEKQSGLYLPHNIFTYPGCADHRLLQKAIDKQLTIITKDVKFVIKAMLEGVNIVFQNEWGQRYYVYGSKTKKMKGQWVSKKYTLTNSQKKAQLITQFTPATVCLSGFHSLFCF